MKYMGSKNRISKDILPIIQKCIDDNGICIYLEPFVGGANIIDKIKCDKRCGNDSNKYLIDFWKQLQNGWNPLSDVEITKELYNKIKDNKEEYPNHIVALAGLCATYNAKWFGGYAGIVKTKIDTYRNYYDEAVRNVLSQIDDLKNVEFTNKDYYEYYPVNCFVYCDPPYEGTTKYKDNFDHEKFWDWVREISKRNFVVCSEYNAPDDFQCIWSKELITTLDKASRSKSVEKLFTYTNGEYYDYVNNLNFAKKL